MTLGPLHHIIEKYLLLLYNFKEKFTRNFDILYTIWGGIVMESKSIFHAIHHVAIIASDYEKSRHFYVDLLGFEVIRENYRETR